MVSLATCATRHRRKGGESSLVAGKRAEANARTEIRKTEIRRNHDGVLDRGFHA